LPYLLRSKIPLGLFFSKYIKAKTKHFYIYEQASMRLCMTEHLAVIQCDVGSLVFWFTIVQPARTPITPWSSACLHHQMLLHFYSHLPVVLSLCPFKTQHLALFIVGWCCVPQGPRPLLKPGISSPLLSSLLLPVKLTENTFSFTATTWGLVTGERKGHE
jgi:hypothetical protein